MRQQIKLIKISKAPKSSRFKYFAFFNKNGKEIKRGFGANSYSDYTIHKDKNRRNRYIKRHLKDLKTNDPTRAGYLSMYVLWNYPSLTKSISDYKRRLNIYNRTGKFPKKIQ